MSILTDERDIDAYMYVVKQRREEKERRKEKTTILGDSKSSFSKHRTHRETKTIVFFLLR